jgi:hypothetical protein
MADLREALGAFRLWWLAEHTKEPERYPLEQEHTNRGLWHQAFLLFVAERPDLVGV